MACALQSEECDVLRVKFDAKMNGQWPPPRTGAATLFAFYFGEVVPNEAVQAHKDQLACAVTRNGGSAMGCRRAR